LGRMRGLISPISRRLGTRRLNMTCLHSTTLGAFLVWWMGSGFYVPTHC
jgi:hypothetical protein